MSDYIVGGLHCCENGERHRQYQQPHQRRTRYQVIQRRETRRLRKLAQNVYFILNVQRPDLFAVVGQTKPSEETDQAETNDGDTEAILPALLLSLGLPYTPGGGLLQHQAAFDRANHALYAIM